MPGTTAITITLTVTIMSIMITTTSSTTTTPSTTTILGLGYPLEAVLAESFHQRVDAAPGGLGLVASAVIWAE